MDGELLRWLYHRLIPIVTFDCTYGDGLIALIGLYAAANNRSLRWASAARHWPLWCQSVLQLPSYSQARRRCRTAAVRLLLRQVNQELIDRLGHGPDKAGDGKPLVVNGFSKDPDATRGHVPGGIARGYRLHAIRDTKTGVIDAARVTGLHGGEATVMRALVRRAAVDGCTLRCDSNYDSNALYAAVAGRGGRLVAPRKRPGTGLGHGRCHHPDRLAAIEELERDPADRRRHITLRSDIERGFADLGRVTGLFALPPFIRRLPRVRLWVHAKLLLYHLLLVLRKQMR